MASGLISATLVGPISGQDRGDFYLNLFRYGERSFLSGDYATAVDELKIGLFGLHGNPEIQGLGYVYLALSYVHLEDQAASREALTRAFAVVGGEGMSGLMSRLREGDRQTLEGLLKEAGIEVRPIQTPPVQDEAPPPVSPPKKELPPAQTAGETAAKAPPPQKDTGSETVEESRSETVPVPVRPIELKVQPTTVPPLEVPEKTPAQAENPVEGEDWEPVDAGGDSEALALEQEASRILADSPDDVAGRLLMGRALYLRSSYSEAEVHLERALALVSAGSSGSEILDEIRAYLILSAHSREDRRKARRIFSDSPALFTPERIEALPLNGRDLGRFREIVSIYRRTLDLEPSKTIGGVFIEEAEDELVIEVICPDSSSHRIFEMKTPAPQRIVIDFADVTGCNAPPRKAVNAFGVQAVRTGMFKTDTARVVIDAAAELPRYRIEKSVHGLRIIIRKR